MPILDVIVGIVMLGTPIPTGAVMLGNVCIPVVNGIVNVRLIPFIFGNDVVVIVGTVIAG